MAKMETQELKRIDRLVDDLNGVGWGCCDGDRLSLGVVRNGEPAYIAIGNVLRGEETRLYGYGWIWAEMTIYSTVFINYIMTMLCPQGSWIRL